MAKIRYSAAAIQDLEEIGDYIAEILKSPMAALNTVNKIQDTIDKLADFPLIGSPLSDTVGAETKHRFLVCGNYLAFYRMEGSTVFVVRIIYSKRDYVRVLFKEMPE